MGLHNFSAPLFSKHDMSHALEAQKYSVAKAVNQLTIDSILNTPIEDMTAQLVDRFVINVPELDETSITVTKPREVEIDAPGNYGRARYGRAPTYVNGFEVAFTVPFSGDEMMFHVRPTTFNFSPPQASVSSNTLTFCFRDTELVPEKIRKQFDDELKSIKQFLDWQRNDVGPFNAALSQLVLQHLTERREKLRRNQNAVDSLGFPVKG